jgi:hypothetical protein
MAQRSIAIVMGSALATRYRVTAAAVPPGALDTMARETPKR